MATLAGADDQASLTGKLNARRLARLAADLLWVQGFREIRIVDGPGDGGRDVHAVSPRGIPALVQCKYHQDPTRTCSSRELGELPLALIKLKCRMGMFVTNAAISPQGKREYLNDYPDLALVFLDGDELARVVLQHPILKALWFDGDSLTTSGISTSFPCIVRVHDGDASLLLTDAEAEEVARRLTADSGDLNLTVTASTVREVDFEPYRYPQPFTAEEGASPFSRGHEIRILGELDLHVLSEMGSRIAHVICAVVTPRFAGTTVRVGRPRIVPLAGPAHGKDIFVDIDPFSAVRTEDCEPTDEISFLEIGDSTWTSTTDARVSEASEIRLYEPTLDVCSTYEVRGRPSLGGFALTRTALENFKAQWRESVFVLAAPDFDWKQASVPDPDDSALWPWDGRNIFAWFSGNVDGGLVVPRSINEPHPFTGLDDARLAELRKIRASLDAIEGVELVDAEKARYMVALVARDQCDMPEQVIHDTASVATFPANLPSPVLPSSRNFEVLAAWSFLDQNAVPPIDELTAEVGTPSIGPLVVSRDDGYLLARWAASPSLLRTLSTATILSRISSDLESELIRVEEVFRRHGFEVRRATREYWRARHGVALGVHASASDKAYAWTAAEGKWRVAWAGAGYDGSGIDERPVGASDAVAQAFMKAGTQEQKKDS
jgi:hypothetical protein